MSREFVINKQRLDEFMLKQGWNYSNLQREGGFSWTTIQRIKYGKSLSISVAARLSKTLCNGEYDERLFARVEEKEDERDTKRKSNRSRTD